MGYVVPRAYIDNFGDGIEAISAANKEALERALANVDITQPGSEGAVVAVMQAICHGGTKQAAYLARQFYLGLRERMIGDEDGYEGAEETGYVPGKTEVVTRGIVRANPAEAALAQLRSRVGYEVKRASGSTMYACGRSDPKKPRFARIPRRSRSYANGCPFCQMLASRGFVYLSELSAGATNPDHYHDDCRCQVVPSWERSPRVEGYDRHDYDAGYQRWLEQDHSRHEQMVEDTQKNRYDRFGRLRSGDGLRRDQKRVLTDQDRAAARRKRTADGNATKNGNRFSALSESDQRAYVATRDRLPGLTVASWQRDRKQ